MVSAMTHSLASPPDAALEALVRADHGDPFALLGPHRQGPG